MTQVKQTSAQSAVNQAVNLLNGHEDFVERSTGLTVDPHVDHYLQNPDYVLSNNRHFIADTMAEYQPNGDATTEGQALHVLGYCHAYIATKNPVFLDKAKKAWDAYINYFYKGQEIPSTPSRYICNWIINGKQPTLADYPVNPEEPTQGGFKCVPIEFTNGVGRIPHGAPFWGEYLDSCTFAHRGHMTWDAINGSVQKIQENVDGKIDWQTVYDQYRILGTPTYDDFFMDTFTDGRDTWTGFTSTSVIPTVTGGWIKPPRVDDTNPVGIRKDNITFNGGSYETLRLRIKKTGNPVWAGAVWWVNVGGRGWDETRKFSIPEPKFDASGVAEIAVNPGWNVDIRTIRVDVGAALTADEYAKSFFEIDYIGVSHKTGEGIAEPWSSLAWIDWKAYLGDTYTVKWGESNHEETFPVQWLVVWTNNKIGMGKGPNDQLWDGDIIEENLPDSDKGMIKLHDETINGVYLVNYASKVPVDFGGYEFARNEPWHNRPVHTPFLGGINQLGNAADAEVWFTDACYLLYRITGEEKYKTALESVFFTANEYTEIDSTDKFFRQSLSAETPFTDAISYGFSYPASTTVTYDRDSDGYIVVNTDQSCQTFLEQQAVVFRITDKSKLRLTYGGQTETGKAIGMSATLTIGTTKGDDDSENRYKVTLPKTNDPVPKVYDISLSQLAKATDDATGEDYLIADSRAVTDYGNCTWEESYEDNVYDGRTANVIKAKLPTSDDGFIIGFWLTEEGKVDTKSIVYRADSPMVVRITDDNDWYWYWIIGETYGKWVKRTLDPKNLTLYATQPNHSPDEPLPTEVKYTKIEQMNIFLEDETATDKEFSYYCVNDVPPLFKGDDGWTVLFRAALTGDEAFTAVVGDCTILDYRHDSLAYSPGVIPFSNIYGEGTNQIGAWHGMPYPGYQYPFMYTIHVTEKYAEELANQIQFLYDSQEAYYKQVGILGPGCAAYIWNRWDNYKYGTPDTWTTYHWGDGKPWSGYQPRAYNAAARAWYELSVRGKTVPRILKEYVERWSTWLVSFAERFGGHSPNDFPIAPEQPVWIENDFTAHMCGLWLAGACYSRLAGSKVEGLDYFIDSCAGELAEGFTIVADPTKAINGAWSPDPRVSGDNGMSFGFYTGECFRGLSLYIIYKNHGIGYDFYQDLAVPDHFKASINV